MHINPALGAVKLADLHPHTVQSFINGIERAPATVRLICGVLSEALEMAVELDYIQQNPVKRCTLPRREQKKIQPLTDREVTALLDAAKGGPLEHLIIAALFTGMRLSELLGLTWDCVDFDKGTITVNKQLAHQAQRSEGELFTSTKSNKTVAAAPSVLSALKAQRKKQIEKQLRAGSLWDNANNLIFTNETGGSLSQRLTDYHFRNISDAAGLKGTRFHDCRHSHAALLVELGYSIVAVAERLGDTVKVAMSTYTHLYPNKMAVMAEVLNRETMSNPAGGDSDSISLADVADRLETVEHEPLSD